MPTQTFESFDKGSAVVTIGDDVLLSPEQRSYNPSSSPVQLTRGRDCDVFRDISLARKTERSVTLTNDVELVLSRVQDETACPFGEQSREYGKIG